MPPKIFVSGTRDDLESCHHIVREALLSLGWEPVQEVASQDETAEDRLCEKILECEAVLYLVGECYGPDAPPNDSDDPPRSFAQLEFEIAWQFDKRICIFVFADDFPFDVHEPESSDRQALQKAHRAGLCANHKHCVSITTKVEIADRLTHLLPRAEDLRSDTQTDVGGVQLLDVEQPRRLRAAPDSECKEALFAGLPNPRMREAAGSPHAELPPPAAPVSFQQDIQFTAYRPKAIAPAKWTKMLVFAHLNDRPDWLEDNEMGPIEEMEQEAARILGSKIEDYRSTTSDSSLAIPQDGEITLVPEIGGIEFNPLRRAFLWKDGVTVHHETFDMRATAMLDGKTARGRLTIFLGPVILAEIALSISVGNATKHASAFRDISSARAFRRVFMSYSHRDLQIVEAAERYGSTLGDEYIRDLIYLRSGELWNDQLQQLVRWADVFQLFWSVNAAGSKYVEDEWRYALSLNRPKFVRPTYWQEPMPEPPEPLRSLHFSRLIPGQSEVLAPSAKSEPASKPELSPPMKEMPRFMPSSPAPDYSGRSFMPSPSIPNPREPRPAPSALRTGWTLQGKLIVLGLVVAVILLVVIISLTTRP